MTKKFTKKEIFTAMMNDYAANGAYYTIERETKDGVVTFEVTNAEIVDFLEKEIGLVTKKGTKKANPEAEVIRENVVNVMTAGTVYTATDIVNALREKGVGTYTTQRVTPVLKALEGAGVLRMTTDKKRNYYEKA